ncbi:MAG: pitrilysin family protein [Pseudomonadota bacterium]
MIAKLRVAALGLMSITMLSTPTVAQEPVDLSNLVIAPSAETFTLDNGLEVVVIPDRRAPIVTHMLWYRAGSADEPPGKSGIAHYLEHLMFKGTEENPGNTFSAAISRVGGRENAFTSNDYTGYFQQVSKEHLPAMMAFEADRMTGLILNEAVSAPELNVVLEERRSRVETRPSAELGEAMDAALYVNHPYGDPVIGWPDEVAALDHEDALDFYRDHYRPSNAVLVVAGDVTVDEIKKLSQETYGAIPAGDPASDRDRPAIQPLRAERTVTLSDPRVRQPSTQIAWIVPSYNTAEPGIAEALDVLAEILGGTNTSRLYTAMVRDAGIATSAGAWYQSSAVDETRFMFYATPRDGVELERLEAQALEMIKDIAENGVTDHEVARAKTTVLASVIFAQDSQSSLARIFGAALTTGSTVEDVQQWPARISAVTAADVQAAAKAFLQEKGTVTGRLLPDKPA